MTTYEAARERYAALGVDTEKALSRLKDIPVSMHCWQGDDIHGLLASDRPLSGGIQVTGDHPGCARNAAQLRADMEKALSLIPGTKKVNLHAI